MERRVFVILVLLLGLINFSFISAELVQQTFTSNNALDILYGYPSSYWTTDWGYIIRIVPDALTLQHVCTDVFEYDSYVSHTTQGRWATCTDNYALVWSSSQSRFVVAEGCDYTVYLATVICEKESCSPLDCSSFPRLCGSTLDDNCSGILNCSTQCKASEICNATGSCVCESGYEDCDGNWSNGCESQMETDIDNCGNCGNNCITMYGVGATCVSGACVSPDFNYWTDMNGMPLLKSNFVVDLYDSVRLVSSANPNYNVTNGENSFVVSNRYWKVGTPGEDYNFSSDDGWSINLIDVRDKVDNSPLGVEIVSPSCGEYFDVGSTRTVEVIINDSDDAVFGNVTIDGVVVRGINNTRNNVIVFDYIFNKAGNIGIIVNAFNDRGEKFKATVNVMVIDTTKTDYYVAACIDEPKNFERFDTSRIFFNASSTRGLKYNLDDIEPYEIIPKEMLNFSWSFKYSTGEHGEPCVGLGSEYCFGDIESPVYAFYKTFPTVNENKAFLSVSISGV